MALADELRAMARVRQGKPPFETDAIAELYVLPVSVLPVHPFWMPLTVEQLDGIADLWIKWEEEDRG